MSFELDNPSKAKGNVERAKGLEVLESGSGNYEPDRAIEQSEEEQLFSEQVFNIPLILKQILKHLEIEDLLRTSLVNKYWNFISREVLRQNERCLAIVKRTDFWSNLRKLNDLLLNSEAVPFNGINVAHVGSGSDTDDHNSSDDFSQLISNILKKIKIKFLFIPYISRDRDSNCIALVCIREIIIRKASELEGLYVSNLPWPNPLPQTFSEFIDMNLKGHWLPNLRILEFRHLPNVMLKELVGASPKLIKLKGLINPDCLEFVLPSKTARHVTYFNFRPTINSLGNCAAFCRENPQLIEMRFSTCRPRQEGIHFSSWSEFHRTELSRIVIQILKSSQDSLYYFCCDHRDLILMTCRWNIPVLKNVYCLCILNSSYVDNGEVYGYSTFRKINWEKYFPNLEQIDMTDQRLPHLESDFYIDNAFRESNAEFVCESVKKLQWLRSLNVVKIQICKSIFPNVKELHFGKNREIRAVLNELWTAWPDLEIISAIVILADPIPNYDSLFLGISGREAAHLRKNVEDLESLEIVPTKPCIFNLRKLKKLEIFIRHNAALCREARPITDSIFLSRLAGQCAFLRIPGLAVEFHSSPCMSPHNCQLALDHVRPFVKYVVDQ